LGLKLFWKSYLEAATITIVNTAEMSGKDDTSFGGGPHVPPASNNEKVLDSPHEEDVRRRPKTTKGYHYVMDCNFVANLTRNIAAADILFARLLPMDAK